MGYLTSMAITREDALFCILSRVNNLTDEELSAIMYDIYGEKNLNNFYIVSDYNGNDYCKYNERGLDD